jgi:hypothetical protein
MSAMPAHSAPDARAADQVQLVPVPRPDRAAMRRGTGALRLAPAQTMDAAPAADPTVWAGPDDEDEPPSAPDLARLPDPRRWSALLAQAVVEILAGRRPVAQVVRWVDPEITERLRCSAPTPVRAAGAVPVRVRRVRVSTSVDGTVEAVAVVDDGTRCRAIALRLEALHRRWVCTSLDLV